MIILELLLKQLISLVSLSYWNSINLTHPKWSGAVLQDYYARIVILVSSVKFPWGVLSLVKYIFSPSPWPLGYCPAVFYWS